MGLNLDLRGRRKDGTDFPAAISLSYITTDEGSFAVSFISDLTKHKRAEEALRFRELAQLPEANPFPVLRCDKSGRILYQNPAARDFTTRIGAPEKAIADLLPADFTVTVRKLIDEDRTVADETRRAIGRTLSFTYKPLREMQQIFVVIVDITDHVQAVQQCRTYAGELEAANRQLRETEAQLCQRETELRQLAQLPEANPFPVLRCDDTGRILYLNPLRESSRRGSAVPRRPSAKRCLRTLP